MAETTPAASTTASDLMRFLDWARDKGEMKANTAHALKAASKAVLEVAGDGDLGGVDVRTLDLDTVFRRFENLPAGMNLSSGSLRAYKQRVAQAIELFLAWSADRTGWRQAAGRTPKPSPNGKPKPKATKHGAAPRPTPPAHEEPAPPAPPPGPEPRGRLVDYPFPLREGLMVRLFLPADLKRAEVRRLNAYMTTLAADGEEGQG